MSTRNTLLLADDMNSNRTFLRRLFEEDYDILEAEDGEETLQVIADNQDQIAAVLLDIIMPVKDGYQVLAEMRERGFLPDIPVIVVTSDSSQKSEARALELGALDLVAKPYDPYIIRRRVQNLVELKRSRRMLAKQVGEMEEVMRVTDDSIVNTLATITEFRSLESGQHILRIRKFVEILLQEVAHAFPEYELDDKTIATISSAAVLHDIGKISIPDAILNKPGKLTAEEFDVMKTHTTAGCEILEGMTQVVDREYMRYAYNICRYHHERWDGRGYPDGLKGTNIPICAQVVGIADVYDALTTKRVYKGAVGHEESANMILNGECGVFNPRLLECFKNVLGDFSECARSYADGQTADAQDLHVPLPPPKAVSVGISTQQMAAIKYHTLLNHVGGVVIEVDVDTDTYHLVYDSNKLFSELHRDGSFERILLRLVKNIIHPDDRVHFWDSFLYLKKGFFEEGLRRYSLKFRIKAEKISGYFWVESTFLRVETGDPNQRKAIVAWKRIEENTDKPAVTPAVEEWGNEALREMNGMVLHCRNDKWQSIVSGSERLANILGYAQEEFYQSYHGRLMDVILPEDRETVQVHVDKQLTHTSTVEVEYRLLGKGGRVFWMRDRARVFSDKDGVEYVYHALVDNTNVQESLEQLRSVRDRHQLLLNQIDEIVFEWDVIRDHIVFSANFKKQFGYEPNSIGFGQYILNGSPNVHPEDLVFLQEIVRAIRKKQPYPNHINAELRLLKSDGSYAWRRLRANVQQMENGKIESIIGVLVDIDAGSRAEGIPQDREEQDLLTKLYNKEAALYRIEKYLRERRSGEQSALLLIDLDQFRMFNRSYGRIAGDTVLHQCTALLQKHFRREDLLARIGGDEFLVLVKNVPSDTLLQRKCEYFADTLSKEVAMAVGVELACSIGIAMPPRDGETFAELFRHAKQALLKAKQESKNSFSFYHQGETAETAEAAVGSPIESDEFTVLGDEGLVFYTFNRLYQSQNIEETIQSILGHVGRQMGVSRVYIFENSPDNLFCSNTFEWCKEGIATQKDSLQNVSYELDVPGWASNYNGQGVFLCENIAELPDEYRAILAPQGIKSMLQCAIMDDGIFRGFVGFDECQTERTWTREQMDVLSVVAKLTSVFLMKKRVKDINNRWSHDLVELMERSASWIYVMDPDTCEILYMNRKMQDSFPEIKTGNCCYKALMKQEKQCANCVAVNIREKERCNGVICSEKLGIRIKADAAMFSWYGRDAVLIMCERELT